MTLDGFSDLLGDPPADDRFELPPVESFSPRTADAHMVSRGVTVAWLSEAFGLARAVTQNRLAGCPALRTVQNGGKIYDVRVAAAYLVKPRVDVAEYIRTMDVKDLPEHLRKEFWNSRLAEQKWRREAGQLWHDDDVMAVFGEVFKAIKETTLLWADELPGLTDEQRETQMGQVDRLLGLISRSLTELEGIQQTLSQASEIDDVFNAQDA